MGSRIPVSQLFLLGVTMSSAYSSNAHPTLGCTLAEGSRRARLDYEWSQERVPYVLDTCMRQPALPLSGGTLCVCDKTRALVLLFEGEASKPLLAGWVDYYSQRQSNTLSGRCSTRLSRGRQHKIRVLSTETQKQFYLARMDHV